MSEENKNNNQGQKESDRTPEEMTENDLDQVSGGVQSIKSGLVDKWAKVKTTLDDGYVYHPIKSDNSII